MILTDGIFAASGELAPLAAYGELLESHEQAAILVDDAHGVGVLGADGRGSWEHHGLSADEVRRFVCATLSKALGGYGGIVAGSRTYIDELKSQASIFGGATPPPPAVAAGSLAALQLLQENPQRRQQLATNVEYLRRRLAGLGLPVTESPSPVISWSFDDAAHMRKLQAALQAAGIMIAYLPNYAGVGGEGILRLAVFATHSTEMLDTLLDQLGSLL